MSRDAGPATPCAEIVEMVTDHLEGALCDDDLARFLDHLAGCDGCTAYLDQMRTTARLLGAVPELAPEVTLGPEAESAVLGAFRRWSRDRSGR
jgi:predicted anti-sigma-YlaC factor YlaD